MFVKLILNSVMESSHYVCSFRDRHGISIEAPTCPIEEADECPAIQCVLEVDHGSGCVLVMSSDTFTECASLYLSIARERDRDRDRETEFFKNCGLRWAPVSINIICHYMFSQIRWEWD